MVGWSTEKMEETESKQEFKDSEKMVQWRRINQEWKEPSEKFVEEVLDKNEVEVSKRGGYKGRTQPLEWRVVQRVKKCQPRKW